MVERPVPYRITIIPFSQPAMAQMDRVKLDFSDTKHEW